MMEYILSALMGAGVALMASWYWRHRDERTEGEQAKESRLNTPEERARAEEEARLRKQFDNLMRYTGKEQKK